ncbi:hypothetical protein GTS_50890 [Gandjariella thermophila]|uniref:Uncharacterized protein n=1 Tax=Gandjariella thermophila TaxID=1931992 RepID=A0A4D4JGC2_9PSEU|nr:hypothetical protein GTS_50890 [Gandjariella thermophila]
MADWTAARVLAWRDVVGGDLLDRVHALVMASLPADHEVWRTIRGDAVLASRIRGMLPGVQRRVADARDAAMGKVRVSAAKRALDPPREDAGLRQRPHRMIPAPARPETRTAPSADAMPAQSTKTAAVRSRDHSFQAEANPEPQAKPRAPLFQAPGTAPTSPTRGTGAAE